MILELATGGIILYLLYYLYQRPRRLDLLGPKGVPILGNLLQLDPQKPHQRLSEWSDKYGGVYTIQLLSENWVVVGDYDNIHRVLVTEGMDYAGRPINNFRINYLSSGRKSIVWQLPGENYWGIGRSIIQRSMKQYGSGMQRIETTVTKMTQRFIAKQRSYGGQPHDPADDVYNLTLSMIIHMSVGRDMDEHDEFFTLCKRMERTFVTAGGMTGPGTELDMFPWLRFFGNWAYGQLTEYRGLVLQVWDRVKVMITEQIDRENPQCIMDAQWLAKETTLDKNGRPVLEEINLAQGVADQLVAGLSTTGHSLLSLLGVLLHYPEVMRHMQQEVDTMVGPDRCPSLNDRDDMPYTRAVIFETLRWSTVVPLSVPHATMKDKVLAGAQIPKATTVITNIWHLHHDEKFWGDPYKFRPERFLNDYGELVPPDHPNRKHLMAFGAGTRVCVGEIFAMARMFLIITMMMQNFDVLPDPDCELPSCDPRDYDLGIVLTPRVGKLRIVPRGKTE